MNKLLLSVSLLIAISSCNLKPKSDVLQKGTVPTRQKDDNVTELEQMKKTGSSFYAWYFKNKFNYIAIVSDKYGKCLLDTTSYFAQLRKLNTISEKFITREKERLSGCRTFISTVDYAVYEAADAYEYDEYCQDLYYMYWIHSQEEPDSFAAKNIRKLDTQHAAVDIAVKYGSIEEPLSNVKLEKEQGSWKITAIDFPKREEPAKRAADFSGSWGNSLVSLEIGKSSITIFYHGQCAYTYPIHKLTETSFEMIWSRDMDCKFDNGTDNTFGLTDVPVIGKPFAKFSYQNNVLYVDYYFKDWVRKYAERVNNDVFTLKYFRKKSD